MNEEFVYLYPFLSNAVHESEIWAEEATAFMDVESVHAEVSLWTNMTETSFPV